MVMIENPLIPAVMASLIGSVPAMKLEQLSFDCLSEVFTFIEVGQWHTLQILGEKVHPYFEIGLKLAAKRLFPGYPIRFDECSFSGVIKSLVLQPGQAELIGDDGPNPELLKSFYTGEVIMTEVMKVREPDLTIPQTVDPDLMVLCSKEKTTIVNLKTKKKREICKVQDWQILPKFVDEHTMAFLKLGKDTTWILNINRIQEDGSLKSTTEIPIGGFKIYALRKVNENHGYSALEAIIVEKRSNFKFILHFYDALTGKEKKQTLQIDLLYCKVDDFNHMFSDDGTILLFNVVTTLIENGEKTQFTVVNEFDIEKEDFSFQGRLFGIKSLPHNCPKHRRIALDIGKDPSSSDPKWMILDIHQNLRWKIPKSHKVESIAWLSEDLFVAVSDDSYQVRSANQFGRLICECNRDSQSPNMPCDQPVSFNDIRFPEFGSFYPGFVYADLNQGFLCKLDFVRTHD